MTSDLSKTPPIVRLSYRKGDLIIKEGDYGVSIYKIMDGKVGVYKEAEGREILLSTLGPGDLFGERTFLGRAAEIRSASVRALEHTTVEVWHTARLSSEYKEMPPIIKYIIDQVLVRSNRMNTLIVQLVTKEQKEKAARKRSDPLASERKFYRKKVDLPCRYRPLGASNKFSLGGRIKDISLGGLAMAVMLGDTAGVSHAKGGIFVVNVVLPNRQNLELEAEVMAVQRSEMPEGLVLSMSITEISAGSRKSLGFFLMP